ncbi:MAG: hypothetical protein M1150_00330 [Patescibacteria group bacterium]|nr:hypothetical protein [Patescibacteria group bacterium]
MLLFSLLNPETTQACTSVGCYLSKNGGLVSFPLVTMAGLIDGINPCAIGMLILLLGYLIVFAGKPERVLKTGLIYIISIYITYFIIGVFFYQSAHLLDTSSFRKPFNLSLTLVLFIAGVLNVKDYFKPDWGVSLGVPKAVQPFLLQWVEKVSLPATAILGIIVTLLETPCSLPIYVGTAKILSDSGYPYSVVLAYLGYYNFLFILPLIIILILVWKGKEMVTLKEWEHRGKKYMKLSLGIFLVLLSGALLIFA